MTRPVVVATVAGIRDALAGGAGGTVALVPTMGALHEGHLALVDRARALADTVVVSVFVNPTQFTQAADLERYPRDLDADLDAVDRFGVAYVFAPGVDEMYPRGPGTTVNGGPVATMYEGRSRPGHFDGVLTVVAKLLGIVRPDVVLFGQKDAQQLFLVQRMVDDLNIDTRVEPVATVRAEDGLALSSRNRFLSPEERVAATSLRRALDAAASAAARGAAEVRAASRAVLDAEELVKLDYFEVVDPETFLPVGDDHHGPARALVAAQLGSTRLIDNDAIDIT